MRELASKEKQPQYDLRSVPRAMDDNSRCSNSLDEIKNYLCQWSPKCALGSRGFLL